MRLFEQLRSTPHEISSLPVPVKRVTLMVFVYFISWGLVIPFLPLFFYDVLGSYGAVTVISALVTVFSILWLFPVGEFLDRFSQRKIMRLTLILYLPIWPILAFLQTFVQAVIYQIYHSIVATLFWSSAETYTRTHSTHGKRSIAWSLHDIGKASSLILGALVGGVLLEYLLDIRVLFITIPPIFVLAAFVISRYLPKDPSKADLRARDGLRSIHWRRMYIKQLRDFWSVPGLRKIWPFIFLLGFLGASHAVMIPLFANAAGASYLFIGILFALFTVPVLFEAPFSVLADTWSDRHLVIFGSLIAAASLLGFGLSTDLLILFPLSFLLGISVSMLLPTISGAVGDRMLPSQTGELNAVVMASHGVGGIAGLAILGPLADTIGLQETFFISSAAMFFSCILAVLIWDRSDKGPRKAPEELLA